MDKESRSKLVELEIDVDKSLDRFMGNEELYFKFLKRYAQDETIEKIRKAMIEKDYGEAEMEAHTMKGVAFNLGLDALGRQFDEIVQNLRRGETAQAEKSLTETETAYNRFVGIVKGLD